MTEDLVTIRNLIEGGGSPLRSFDGTYGGYDKGKAEGYEGWRVVLHFSDLDNIVSISPYNFPTADLNFGLSNKNKSKWGYFGNSLIPFLPGREDIKDCTGKKMSLVYCDGIDGRPAPKPIWNKDEKDRYNRSLVLESSIAAAKDADALENLRKELEEMGEIFPEGMKPIPVWIITAVDGASSGVDSGNAAEWAEENLIGKTVSDFNKWALADSKVRAANDVQRAIVDKSFVQGLLALGKVVKDSDDVFQRPA